MGGMDIIYAVTHLIMVISGCFIIVTEAYYLPRLVMYVKCHQTLWGRCIFFTVLALLSYMNGDVLHIICLAVIGSVVLFYVLYGLVSACWLKIPFGVPPPLYGFPQTEQAQDYKQGDP